MAPVDAELTDLTRQQPALSRHAAIRNPAAIRKETRAMEIHARALGDGLDQQRACGVRIRTPPAQAQGARPDRVELSLRLRIPAREQGDVVSELDQFVDKPGDHALRAT
jgi:hypothetical protein